MSLTVVGVICAAALIPMPKSIQINTGSVSTGEVQIVEKTDKALVPEGYRIKIDENGVVVSASD
jgi:hypothetical protein